MHEMTQRAIDAIGESDPLDERLMPEVAGNERDSIRK